ncbi:contractile injection system tape measure protein [Cellvibrio japonicus]|uniref:contractile injection system tape measure protein n=1 Tax=Cellvibrio japonicus TaxID=155077 RepID=UPI0002DFE428|nr:contractile injection system tape measure protein [Cellvibrio japonicus]QEI13882.1 hypothetical protein FY117_17770 [Cellvibrio japonicus]QEI17456.1 hypothetical protein FY116_17775 [Cellvibrio japonicus]QEI21032.1 hypothetical protein FY115_17770 [Cellvibrio japonicus]
MKPWGRPQHSIDELVLDLGFSSRSFAQREETELVHWLSDELLPALNRLFDHYSPEPQLLRFDTLSFDFGPVPASDYRAHIQQQLLEQFAALIKPRLLPLSPAFNDSKPWTDFTQDATDTQDATPPRADLAWVLDNQAGSSGTNIIHNPKNQAINGEVAAIGGETTATDSNLPPPQTSSPERQRREAALHWLVHYLASGQLPAPGNRGAPATASHHPGTGKPPHHQLLELVLGDRDSTLALGQALRQLPSQSQLLARLLAQFTPAHWQALIQQLAPAAGPALALLHQAQQLHRQQPALAPQWQPHQGWSDVLGLAIQAPDTPQSLWIDRVITPLAAQSPLGLPRLLGEGLPDEQRLDGHLPSDSFPDELQRLPNLAPALAQALAARDTGAAQALPEATSGTTHATPSPADIAPISPQEPAQSAQLAAKSAATPPVQHTLATALLDANPAPLQALWQQYRPQSPNLLRSLLQHYLPSAELRQRLALTLPLPLLADMLLLLAPAAGSLVAHLPQLVVDQTGAGQAGAPSTDQQDIPQESRQRQLWALAVGLVLAQAPVAGEDRQQGASPVQQQAARVTPASPGTEGAHPETRTASGTPATQAVSPDALPTGADAMAGVSAGQDASASGDRELPISTQAYAPAMAPVDAVDPEYGATPTLPATPATIPALVRQLSQTQASLHQQPDGALEQRWHRLLEHARTTARTTPLATARGDVPGAGARESTPANIHRGAQPTLPSDTPGVTGAGAQPGRVVETPALRQAPGQPGPGTLDTAALPAEAHARQTDTGAPGESLAAQAVASPDALNPLALALVRGDYTRLVQDWAAAYSRQPDRLRQLLRHYLPSPELRQQLALAMPLVWLEQALALIEPTLANDLLPLMAALAYSASAGPGLEPAPAASALDSAVARRAVSANSDLADNPGASDAGMRDSEVHTTGTAQALEGEEDRTEAGDAETTAGQTATHPLLAENTQRQFWALAIGLLLEAAPATGPGAVENRRATASAAPDINPLGAAQASTEYASLSSLANSATAADKNPQAQPGQAEITATGSEAMVSLPEGTTAARIATDSNDNPLPPPQLLQQLSQAYAQLYHLEPDLLAKRWHILLQASRPVSPEQAPQEQVPPEQTLSGQGSPEAAGQLPTPANPPRHGLTPPAATGRERSGEVPALSPTDPAQALATTSPAQQAAVTGALRERADQPLPAAPPSPVLSASEFPPDSAEAPVTPAIAAGLEYPPTPAPDNPPSEPSSAINTTGLDPLAVALIRGDSTQLQQLWARAYPQQSPQLQQLLRHYLPSPELRQRLALTMPLPWLEDALHVLAPDLAGVIIRLQQHIARPDQLRGDNPFAALGNNHQKASTHQESAHQERTDREHLKQGGSQPEGADQEHGEPQSGGQEKREQENRAPIPDVAEIQRQLWALAIGLLLAPSTQRQEPFTPGNSAQDTTAARSAPADAAPDTGVSTGQQAADTSAPSRFTTSGEPGPDHTPHPMQANTHHQVPAVPAPASTQNAASLIAALSHQLARLYHLDAQALAADWQALAHPETSTAPVSPPPIPVSTPQVADSEAISGGLSGESQGEGGDMQRDNISPLALFDLCMRLKAGHVRWETLPDDARLLERLVHSYIQLSPLFAAEYRREFGEAVNQHEPPPAQQLAYYRQLLQQLLDESLIDLEELQASARLQASHPARSTAPASTTAFDSPLPTPADNTGDNPAPAQVTGAPAKVKEGTTPNNPPGATPRQPSPTAPLDAEDQLASHKPTAPLSAADTSSVASPATPGMATGIPTSRRQPLAGTPSAADVAPMANTPSGASTPAVAPASAVPSSAAFSAADASAASEPTAPKPAPTIPLSPPAPAFSASSAATHGTPSPVRPPSLSLTDLFANTAIAGAAQSLQAHIHQLLNQPGDTLTREWRQLLAARAHRQWLVDTLPGYLLHRIASHLGGDAYTRLEHWLRPVMESLVLLGLNSQTGALKQAQWNWVLAQLFSDGPPYRQDAAAAEGLAPAQLQVLELLADAAALPDPRRLLRLVKQRLAAQADSAARSPDSGASTTATAADAADPDATNRDTDPARRHPRANPRSPINPAFSLNDNSNTPAVSDDTPWKDALPLHNVGQVLAAPFLPRLFSMLNLTAEGRFVHPMAADRAAHLLQFMVDGQTRAPEYELTLNKVLCGISTSLPLSAGIEITEQERNTIEQMLTSMIQHWKVLGSTSIAGLRETFLQRQGWLLLDEDYWRLQVQERSFDLLLDRLPWSIGMIKHSWMDKPLRVTWRHIS